MEPLHGGKLYLDKQHPAVWRGLNGLALKAKEAAEAAGMGRGLIELINIRVSQLNGCAYCLDMHVADALASGETSQRIAVLPAWRDTEVFTPKERAALALAEAVTELPGAHALDRELAEARTQLSNDEFSAVNWLAVTMNAFNRVSIVSRHPVRRPRST